MSTTITMSRQLLSTLRPEIEAAVQAVAKKHGVIINSGSGTFSPDIGTATLRLDIAIAGGAEDGTKAKDIKAAADWDAYAHTFGLKPEWKGKSFASGGHTYTIVGLEPRRHTRPVVAKRADGKSFIFPVDSVCLRMATVPVAPGSRHHTAKA